MFWGLKVLFLYLNNFKDLSSALAVAEDFCAESVQKFWQNLWTTEIISFNNMTAISCWIASLITMTNQHCVFKNWRLDVIHRLRKMVHFIYTQIRTFFRKKKSFLYTILLLPIFLYNNQSYSKKKSPKYNYKNILIIIENKIGNWSIPVFLFIFNSLFLFTIKSHILLYKVLFFKFIFPIVKCSLLVSAWNTLWNKWH